MINGRSKQILCVQVAKGKTHDFALFKGSRLPLAPGIELLADTGYKGVDKLHPNSQTPQTARLRTEKANSIRSPRNKNNKTSD